MHSVDDGGSSEVKLRTLSVGDLIAEPGNREQRMITVFSLAGGADVKMPVILINGLRDGPVLNLHAGIHGDEFEGIAAIRQIAKEIRPENLIGGLIATPIVHMAAYASGTRESPTDGKNLARVFPGDKEGTPTERLAYFFFNDIIMNSDYVIGLHSGGLRSRYSPLIEYYTDVKDEVEKESMAMAEAFAIGPFDIIQRIHIPPPNITCTSESSIRGIPSIEPEMVGEGRCPNDRVEEYVASVINVLKNLGMILDQKKTQSPLKRDGKIDHVEGEWIYATHGGFFIPEIGIRQKVARGQRLGIITDEFGEVLEVVKSPVEGFIGAIRTFPMLRKGDIPAMVLRPIS